MSTPQFSPLTNWSTTTPALGPLWMDEFNKLYGTMYQYWEDCAKIEIGQIIYTTSPKLQGNMAADFVLGEAQLLTAVDYPTLAAMMAKQGEAGYIYDNQVYTDDFDPSHSLNFPADQVPAGQFRLPWLQGMTPVIANLGDGSGANKGFYQNWQPGVYGDHARKIEGKDRAYWAAGSGDYEGVFYQIGAGSPADNTGSGSPVGNWRRGAFDSSRVSPTADHANPPCTIVYGYIRIQYTVQGVGVFK